MAEIPAMQDAIAGAQNSSYMPKSIIPNHPTHKLFPCHSD
jgi:hypothetical protein